MSDARLMVVPCEYSDFPCSSFVCESMHGKRYYVGNPYSGGIHNYPIFCEDCVKHMVSTLPADLSPGGAALEDRIRAELTVQYNDLLSAKVTDATDAIRQDAERFIAYKLAEADGPLAEVPVEETVDVTEQETITFRCLDCGDEFETKEALDAHKVKHAEPPKNKGGRPAKRS